MKKLCAFLLFTLTLVSLLIFISLVTSCTYSIAMVHTEGQASDVVDDSDSPTADIKPILSIPKV